VATVNDWVIRVPFRSREDSLDSVACEATGLPENADRLVAQHLAILAQVTGDRTAGDLIDRLGAMTRKARRRVLGRCPRGVRIAAL
jgi:hypothetical protein